MHDGVMMVIVANLGVVVEIICAEFDHRNCCNVG